MVQHEEAPVDHAVVAPRLFGELDHPLAVEAQGAEAARWGHRGHRGRLAVGCMEAIRRRNVDVADAVAIGKAEPVLTVQEAADTAQAAAGLGLLAGIHQRDPPGLGMALLDTRCGWRPGRW